MLEHMSIYPIFYYYYYLFIFDTVFHLDVHYVCMLVQRFEPQGRRFTNFHYYYYYLLLFSTVPVDVPYTGAYVLVNASYLQDQAHATERLAEMGEIDRFRGDFSHLVATCCGNLQLCF